MRVTGGIRTRNLPIRQKGALSVELQPHAGATYGSDFLRKVDFINPVYNLEITRGED